MTPKQEAILETLTIVPKCVLAVSLSTKIPSEEAGRMLNALARKGSIRKHIRNKETMYSSHNPRTQLKNKK